MNTWEKKHLSFFHKHLIQENHVHYTIRYTQKLNPTKPQAHHMSFESTSRNKLNYGICYHLTSRYIFNGNIFPFYGVFNKIITPLDVLNLPVNFKILANWMATVLSHIISTGSSTLGVRLRSWRKLLSHMASWVARQTKHILLP